MKRLKRYGLWLLLALTLAFTACGQKQLMADKAFGYESAGMAAPAMARASLASDSNRAPDTALGRKFVHTASLDIEIQRLETAEQRVAELLAAYAAYAETIQRSDSALRYSIRVPVASLEDLLADLGGLGQLKSKTLSVQDVTDSYYDLEGRLRNLRILEERYRDYLRQAATIEEILQVERSLSETTTEIEWLEGRFRQLSGQIELASLQLNLYPERSVQPGRPSLGSAVRRLFYGLGQAGRILVLVLLGLVLYGLPAIAVLAGLYWLSFGRLGLLRRLFRLLGKAGREA